MSLEGIRVVDFGWVWAGAVPGHVLADMGAEVIKIETMTRLDYMRQGRPIVGTEKDPEQNPMFQNVNRGKLSFRVDMTKPEGAALLLRLVALSDVVIENFTPGVLDKFGLGWETLQATRPDLIMCSMSAVGQEGPLRDIRTYAAMISALSGMDSLAGYEGGRVLGVQQSYADPNASLHAVFAILAALWRRRSTGEGAYIDLSQWEAGTNVMGEAVIDYSLNGRVPGTVGTRHPRKSPHGNYPAAGEDKWMAISISSDGEWQSLVRWLGEPEWARGSRYATVEGRLRHREELDRLLSKETSRHDAADLEEGLRDQGVAAAALQNASTMPEHPAYVQREVFQSIEHPVLGHTPVYGLPWQGNGEVWRVPRRAPLLGEHNDYVLRELLGLGAEEVDKLCELQVFE